MAAAIDDSAEPWDLDAWMAVAESAALASPCTTKIGAVLVNPAAPFPLHGHNAPPAGFKGIDVVESDGCKKWCVRAVTPPPFKDSGYNDCPTVHAEMGVLIRAGNHTVGSALFVNGATCMQCAKMVAYCHVSMLVCRTTKEMANERNWAGVKWFLEQCGVQVITMEV